MRDKKWARIAVFYGIAITISAFSRFTWHTGDIASAMQKPWSIYLHLVSGLGPALGALAVRWGFGYKSRFSLGGTNMPLAIAMIAAPVAIMTAWGFTNPLHIEPHLFGLNMGIMIAAYASLEELGWRGYLQSEFADRSPLIKYAIVGTFWYAWHLSWVTHPAIGDELFTLLFMILAASGIGFVAERTRSVLAAAAFHIAGNVMGLTSDFQTLMPEAHTRWMMVTAFVAIWLILLRIWRRLPARP